MVRSSAVKTINRLARGVLILLSHIPALFMTSLIRTVWAQHGSSHGPDNATLKGGVVTKRRRNGMKICPVSVFCSIASGMSRHESLLQTPFKCSNARCPVLPTDTLNLSHNVFAADPL